MAQKPLRVAVVSPHPLIRAGFTVLLSAAPERAEVVDVAAEDGHIGYHDVAIYDLAGVIETDEDDLRHLLSSGMPVVALAREPWGDVTATALQRGVVEVVPMSVTAGALLDVLERAAAGQARTAAELREGVRERARGEVDLGDREFDVLELIAAGFSNQEIAEDLYLSLNTIKTYIRALYRKIGVRSRAQAVLWAVHRGLVRTGDQRSARKGDTDRTS